MSEYKFTPGPWKLVPIKNSYWNERYFRIDALIAGCGRMPIAEIDGDNAVWLKEGEDIANANLISSAPDMYAVLKELSESAAYWSEYDVPIGILDRINAALEKADGKDVEG